MRHKTSVLNKISQIAYKAIFEMTLSFSQEDNKLLFNQ